MAVAPMFFFIREVDFFENHTENNLMCFSTRSGISILEPTDIFDLSAFTSVY